MRLKPPPLKRIDKPFLAHLKTAHGAMGVSFKYFSLQSNPAKIARICPGRAQDAPRMIQSLSKGHSKVIRHSSCLLKVPHERRSYAKVATANPQVPAGYEARAAEEGRVAYSVALSDYWKGNNLLPK
jgi:hypothetical protein